MRNDYAKDEFILIFIDRKADTEIGRIDCAVDSMPVPSKGDWVEPPGFSSMWFVSKLVWTYSAGSCWCKIFLDKGFDY
jgi:hypothetical protein